MQAGKRFIGGIVDGGAFSPVEARHARIPETAPRNVAHHVEDAADDILVLAQQQRLGDRQAGRSEEHTSELQSLMRISYAVFCLQKKKQKTIIIEQRTTTIKSSN